MTLSAKLKVKILVYGESDFAELWLLPSNKPDSGMVKEGISIVVSLWVVGGARYPPSLPLSVSQTTDVQLKPLAILA